VTVHRLAYRHRGEENLYPADGTLNLAEELYSHGLVDVRVIPQPNVQLIHHRAPRVLSTPWQLLPPVDVAR
jgi:hypothetical protein